MPEEVVPEQSAAVPVPPSPETKPAQRFSAIQLLGWVTFLSLLGSIGYLFYLGGYRPLIANSSSSSSVELVRRKLEVSRDARTIVIGNSAAAEGFRASFYNNVPGASGPAVNLGVPSAHMFLFEKVVAMALERGMRPEVVVLVLTPEVLSEIVPPRFDFLLNDLTLLKLELDGRDVLRLRNHSRSAMQFADSAVRILLRPALFRGDLRDFVARPRERLTEAATVQAWLDSLTTPENFPETDNHFAVCDAGPLKNLEELLEAERQRPNNSRLADLERVWQGYRDRVDLGGSLAVDEFELQRLRRYLEFLTARVPKVFLVQAPFYDPGFDQIPAAYRQELDRSMSRLDADFPEVKRIPDFPSDCTMMMDTIHLNRRGGELFTVYVREQINATLNSARRN